MTARIALWVMVLAAAALIVLMIGRAYDNVARNLTPSCSAGVCVAPQDKTP